MRAGVDLGGTKIEAALIDDDGSIVERHRVPTPQSSYEDTLQAIARLIARLDSSAQRRCSVGIGTPGALTPKTAANKAGVIKNANSTCLIGHPLDVDLARLLDREVRVQNDANCFALSEAVDGAAREHEIVFGVILGTGAGAGLVFRRQVITGRNAIAGEWGHNPLPWPRDDELPGPRCYCGKGGCVETFVSGPGLELDHAHRNPGSRVIGAAEVARLARRGDPRAVASMGRYYDRLARSLAHVINILDPECIVLGGGVSNVPELYREVPKLWGRYVFSDVIDTPLVPPLHGDSSGVRGAAWLWSPGEFRG